MNEGVTPPTITVGVNGKTAQANLPAGGDEWEELDLNDLPTDFAVYDELKVITKFDAEVTGVNSWNDPPQSPDIIRNANTYAIIYLMLSESTGRHTIVHVASTSAYFYEVSIRTNTPERMNTGYDLFFIGAATITGAGLRDFGGSIPRSRANEYIHKLYRKKK